MVPGSLDAAPNPAACVFTRTQSCCGASPDQYFCSLSFRQNHFLVPLTPRSLFFHKEMELSLIGLQNAGKTSLVNVLTTGQFHEVGGLKQLAQLGLLRARQAWPRAGSTSQFREVS